MHYPHPHHRRAPLLNLLHIERPVIITGVYDIPQRSAAGLHRGGVSIVCARHVCFLHRLIRVEILKTRPRPPNFLRLETATRFSMSM